MPRWIYVPCSGSLVIGQGWGLLIDESLGKINRGKSITLNLVSSKTGDLQSVLDHFRVITLNQNR